MSATAVLLVVIPRLVLGAFAGVNAWRLSRTVALPEVALPYVRQLLAASAAALPATTIQVIAYAYQPACDQLSDAILARISLRSSCSCARRSVSPAASATGRAGLGCGRVGSKVQAAWGTTAQPPSKARRTQGIAIRMAASR